MLSILRRTLAMVFRRGQKARMVLSIAAAVLAGATVANLAKANDINVAPSACQAPFLDQARPMRWHEWYIMNPVDNTTTWVICPLTFDEDVVNWPAGNTSSVNIHGASQTGASGSPLCFLAAADRENLDLDPYVAVPGGARNYLQNLSTNVSPPRWTASGSVSHDAIRSSLNSNSAQNWGMTVLCRLPAGFGISNIFIAQ